ncbi:RluA family pseudouridine synthase [Clostridium algidicarnis]|uniref:RluA family pseudouridine synthase n=1 Tax=Clostridium algidicarnis TaxID=37659 RepID=UPI001C0DBE04|nr:RluA family pseudouridine synthase [Clostridium algidicarnis]MBU3195487.1 RluA family pseudouridine synthase [Clostridium algidicarnis]
MKEEVFLIEEYVYEERVDKYLFKSLETLSRSYIQKLIEENNVLVNDNPVKSKYKIKQGDLIKVYLKETTEIEVRPENIYLDILYEDDDIIIVNKDQGMVVHPASGNHDGTLVNALVNHSSNLSKVNGSERPGIVHRIDKDTSGVLVIAKNDNSHCILAEQFKAHTIKREYYALVEGVLKSDSGTIDTIIGRNPKEKIKFAVVEEGKRAITHYEVLERYENNTLVRCNLETGRTHQIRVHMAYIGHPLVGDPVYGYKKQKFNLKGQMLHAKSLGFIHPTKNQYVEFESELPEYFIKILNTLKKQL